jgi:hypothetical protein
MDISNWCNISLSMEKMNSNELGKELGNNRERE